MLALNKNDAEASDIILYNNIPVSLEYRFSGIIRYVPLKINSEMKNCGRGKELNLGSFSVLVYVRTRR